MPARSSRNQLAADLDALATREGATPTRDPRVTVYRVSAPEPPTLTLYAAGAIIVGQGTKRGHLAGEIHEYDPSHCVVLASPLPMHCEVVVRGQPVLTVGITLDLKVLGELVATLDSPGRAGDGDVRAVHLVPLGGALEETALRLLRQLREADTARVLAPATIRELYFHLLRGPAGGSLRALASRDGHLRQLDRVMRHMNERFAEPMPVDALARMASMSVPTFHQHFKAVTATSPLQYLKAVRLTRARLLMMSGASAKVAAHEVGYVSESQFSREFRRFFGAPPAASVAGNRVSGGVGG